MTHNDPQAELSLFLPSRHGTTLIQRVYCCHDRYSGHLVGLVPVPNSTSGYLSLSRTSQVQAQESVPMCSASPYAQSHCRTARQSHPPRWSFAYVSCALIPSQQETMSPHHLLNGLGRVLVVVGGSHGDYWVCRCHDYLHWWNDLLVTSYRCCLY